MSRRAEKGFTLIEALLSVTLVAAITGVIYSTFDTGLRAHQRCRGRLERRTVVSSAMELIADDLKYVATRARGDRATLRTDTTQADAGAPLLRLRTHARPHAGFSEMLVDYFFMPPESKDATGRLIRRTQALALPGVPRDGDEDSHELPSELLGDRAGRYEIIATGLAAVGFRCFDAVQWHTQWDSAERRSLPRLVEVTLTFADSGQSDAEAATTYTQALPVMVEMSAIGAKAEEKGP